MSCQADFLSSVLEDMDIHCLHFRVTSHAVVPWHMLKRRFIFEKKVPVYECRQIEEDFHLGSGFLFWSGFFDLGVSSVSAN